MATATNRIRCVICNKEKSTLRHEGFLRIFCFSHVEDHRQQLKQTAVSRKHPLIKQIDDWEQDSINKIRQTAEDAKQLLLNYTTRHAARIEDKLNKFINELRQGRQKNDFDETELNQWQEELIQIKGRIYQTVECYN